MPLSVSILGVDPGGVSLLHERIPIFRRAAGKEGDEEMWRIGWKSNNIHDLLVVLAEVEILFVVEEKVLRVGVKTIGVDMRSGNRVGVGVHLAGGKRSNAFLR